MLTNSCDSVKDLRVLWWLCVRVVSVVEAAWVVVCSGIHSCVESWRTVGLSGDGLGVPTPTLKVDRGAAAAVVVTPEGPRPLRFAGFRGVTWLPEAPPPLGFAVVVVVVDRVLPLATVTVLPVGFPPPTVVVVVVVVVSGLLGMPLGLERKIGSCPIRLASTRSVGT